MSRDDLLAAAMADDKVTAAIGSATPTKTIVVVGKLVNFVL
jgi:leucyl-tRNA synthetase